MNVPLTLCWDPNGHLLVPAGWSQPLLMLHQELPRVGHCNMQPGLPLGALFDGGQDGLCWAQGLLSPFLAALVLLPEKGFGFYWSRILKKWSQCHIHGSSGPKKWNLVMVRIVSEWCVNPWALCFFLFRRHVLDFLKFFQVQNMFWLIS